MLISKNVLLLLLNCCFFSAMAQTDSLSKQDKAALDSMVKNDELLQLINEKPKNSIDISVGIGNGSFSSDNNAANATGVNNQLIFTPAITYRIKNGFSFGVTGFIANDGNSKASLYQTGLSGAYDYYGRKVTAGISYTRFLADNKKYNSRSLYQNDFYGYIKKAKGIIIPSLSMGYTAGTYKAADFVSLNLKRPLQSDTLITGNDSTDNKASYFSISGGIEHSFSFYNIFSKNDGLDFVPALLINAGSDKISQTHTNKIFNRKGGTLAKRKKTTASNTLQVQSIAASFDFTYSVGKFFLQPNLYLDYYLPPTTTNRLSALFSLTAGFSF
jgi:hypothetical protein